MWVIIAAAVIVFAVWKIANGGSKGPRGLSSQSGSGAGKANSAAFRCPNCGSPVKINGRQWECGWCGDYGYFR